MARMPGAEWLGEHSPKTAMERYDAVCLHTIVGFAPAHAAHFSVKADGTILQSRDTAYRSGANLDGNHRIIAVEVEDHGPVFGVWDTHDGHAVPAFTEPQVEAIARIVAWAHITHGIPAQPCPNSRPSSRGVAYHRQGVDGDFSAYRYPGRVAGGEVWTKTHGKVCPGDRRIAQIPQVVALAKELLMPKPVPWKRPTWRRPQAPEVVAYANIFDGLPRAAAKAAFDAVRASGAQLVGLGEWGPGRQGILDADEAFTWFKPGPTCPPVGADKTRYTCVTVRKRLLAKGRDVDRKPGGQPSRTHLDDTFATVAVFQERGTGDLVTVINAHLPSASSQIQDPAEPGVWRRLFGALTPRARMARECKRELRAIVKRHWARGRRVYLVGDMNIHNMRLRPLTSCWADRELRPTLNRSTYDMVLAQQPAAAVRLIKTPSDHKAVVATYPKGKP